MGELISDRKNTETVYMEICDAIKSYNKDDKNSIFNLAKLAVELNLTLFNLAFCELEFGTIPKLSLASWCQEKKICINDYNLKLHENPLLLISTISHEMSHRNDDENPIFKSLSDEEQRDYSYAKYFSTLENKDFIPDFGESIKHFYRANPQELAANNHARKVVKQVINLLPDCDQTNKLIEDYRQSDAQQIESDKKSLEFVNNKIAYIKQARMIQKEVTYKLLKEYESLKKTKNKKINNDLYLVTIQDKFIRSLYFYNDRLNLNLVFQRAKEMGDYMFLLELCNSFDIQCNRETLKGIISNLPYSKTGFSEIVGMLNNYKLTDIIDIFVECHYNKITDINKFLSACEKDKKKFRNVDITKHFKRAAKRYIGKDAVCERG